MNTPAMLTQPGAAWTRFWACGTRMAYFDHSPMRDAIEDIWTEVAAAVAPGARILDLGCGAGAALMALGVALSRSGGFASLSGVDLARLPAPAPELAQADLRGETDICDLPYADHSFDLTLSQFGADTALPEALCEIRRVLRPGGRMTLLLHSREGPVWRDAAERLARLDAMFRPGAIVDASAVLASARIGGTAAVEQGALWDAASQAFAAADMATRGSPRDDAARQMLRDLSVVWRARETIGDVAAKEAQEELFAETAAYARRLADFVGAARDAQAISDLAQAVQGVFAGACAVAEVKAAGTPFAWRLDAACPD